jgi:surface antigen
MKRTAAAVVSACLSIFLAVPAAAEPPPWAPAHGWRKKNDPYYTGYTGKKWDRDFGVLSGRCNSDAIGAVLGGAVGGVIGSRVGEGRDRPVAIVLGTVLGAVIGAKIGRDLDDRDRACMGHALELAGERKTVAWTNSATGLTYRLTPTRNFQRGGEPCREFTTVVSAREKKERLKGVACRRGEGDWDVRL